MAFWIVLVFVAVVGGAPELANDLSEKEFRRLHRELNPQNETWKTIPWRTSLLDAQRAAAREQKPIFIWAMDGNPLGCT